MRDLEGSVMSSLWYDDVSAVGSAIVGLLWREGRGGCVMLHLGRFLPESLDLY